MRLGTETGSVINHLLAGSGMPEIGGPATILLWTDRKPGTVIEWDGKIAAVQLDDYRRIDSNGMSESQEYEYTSNPNNPICYFRLGKNGWESVWRNELTNRWKKQSGGVFFGERERYLDFTF